MTTSFSTRLLFTTRRSPGATTQLLVAFCLMEDVGLGRLRSCRFVYVSTCGLGLFKPAASSQLTLLNCAGCFWSEILETVTALYASANSLSGYDFALVANYRVPSNLPMRLSS
ncbi:hypothetical protein R3P38DRAFT_3239140 [Favolaschia claudopus]|uniref:Uncharacterized protein n=1 Tax=Favolaschia claudopus TaxID=2862362 RepID=A0AAV9Z9H9_9AGAR